MHLLLKQPPLPPREGVKQDNCLILYPLIMVRASGPGSVPGFRAGAEYCGADAYHGGTLCDRILEITAHTH